MIFSTKPIESKHPKCINKKIREESDLPYVVLDFDPNNPYDRWLKEKQDLSDKIREEKRKNLLRDLRFNKKSSSMPQDTDLHFIKKN